MSVAAMKWAKRQRVRTTCRIVLNALADRADKEDKCWPSQSLLAAETGLAVRTVRLVLAEMEAAGIIARQHRGNGYGGRASDLITLNLDHDFDLMDTVEQADDEETFAAADAGINKGGYRHIKDGLAAYEGQVSGTWCRGKNLTGNQRNLLPSREQGFQDVALSPTRWAAADADPFGDFDYSPPSSRGSDKSADDWLARADEALYGSGDSGRAKTDFGTLPHDEALKAALSQPNRSERPSTVKGARRAAEVAR